MPSRVLQLESSDLIISILDDGPLDGWPVVLTHGFPYDVHAFDDVVAPLTKRGARVYRPYVRGFGPTTFRSPATLRTGQQAALGRDLIEVVERLGLKRAIVAGFDWGGLASCVAAALWPERVGGLVSYAGYDVVDRERHKQAFDPAVERVFWYQHLFQTERGRNALSRFRNEIAALLWREWSPNWSFDAATFERTAVAFDNPDFVDVVIHGYRFHFGLEQGAPELEPLEAVLARKPLIRVPAITLDGLDDPLKPGGTADHAKMFAATHQHRVIKAGHNIPQEQPSSFADAILTVREWIAADC